MAADGAAVNFPNLLTIDVQVATILPKNLVGKFCKYDGWIFYIVSSLNN